MADIDGGSGRDSGRAPVALVWAARLAWLESGALVAAGAAVLVLTFVHTSTRLWAALTIVAFAWLGAATLWLCGRGLLALRPSSRTPLLIVQLLALPVTYSLGFQAGKLLIGLPILVVALAEIVLLMLPESRRALDRVL